MSVTVLVKSRVPQYVARARAGMEGAVEKAAFDIESRAKGLAPVDTGTLRSAIFANGDGLEWRVDSPVHYSIYQEFGTHKMAAHPFLVPAAEAVKPSLESALKRAVS